MGGWGLGVGMGVRGRDSLPNSKAVVSNAVLKEKKTREATQNVTGVDFTKIS